MGMTKHAGRLWTILVYGASRVISSLGTSLVSLVIIQTQSQEVWGSAVQWVLFFDLVFSVISWGSSQYLLRESSLDPKNLSQHFSASAVARIPLLAAFVVVLLLLPVSQELRSSMLVWALARYIFQWYEPLLQFHRNFAFSLLMELSALVVTLAPLFAIQSLVTGEVVVTLIAAGTLWKCSFATLWVFAIKKIARPARVTRSQTVAFLMSAFPFLLLSFTAMLQQRMDLYVVAYYLDDRDTAVYQVYINWLIFCQFLSTLILSPFAKNIFRVPENTFKTIERRFMMAGLYLSLLSILGVYTVIRLLYRLDIPAWYYAAGYVYILVYYFYALRNYALGKIRKQSTVVVYALLTSGVNFVLAITFVPTMGTSGALLAAVLSQFFLLGLYHLRKSAYAVG